MTDIEKEDITEVVLNGVGTYDHFMKAMKEHLLEEFTEGRIRGADYANVYVGSLTTVMQQAIAFELGKDQAARQAELLAAQTDKVREEIVTEKKQQDLMDCQLKKCAAEIVLLEKQAVKLDAEIVHLGFQNQLLEKQVLKMDDEILLMKAQVINMGFQNDLIVQQIEKMKADVDIAYKQLIKLDAEISLMGKQEEKMDQDILVAKQLVLKAQQEVQVLVQNVQSAIEQVKKTRAEAVLTEDKHYTELKQQAALDAQIEKVYQEVDLLGKKIQTELAQVQDEINIGTEAAPNFVTVAGFIGRKNTLYVRQADGFLRDAEQKAAKVYTDIWNVSKSADPFGVYESVLLGENISYVDDGSGGQIPVADAEKAYIKLERVLDQLRNGIYVDGTPVTGTP